MNRWKRVTAALLLGTMVMGCVSGCGTKKVMTFEKEQNRNARQSISETAIDFVKAGASDYKIVYPNKATENEIFAANELQYFVKEATGAKLSILKETQNMKEGKYIYVGDTWASEKAKIEPGYEDVKYNGFVMKQVDDDLYLRGYSDIGTKNSIYEFLGYMFDYDLYAVDEIQLEKKQDAKLLAFDLTVLPDFDWREVNYGEMIYDDTLSSRMRMNPTEEILVTGHLTHNSMTIIDPDVYDWKSDKYKDWYSEATWTGFNNSLGKEEPSQLCYSNDEMRKEYTKNLIEIIKDSKVPNMLIGIEDNYDWCTCDKCSASVEKYGTASAVTIQFVNKVQADVDAWFEKNRPDDNPTSLVIFAYHSTTTPPATYDAQTDEWKPIDDSVVMNEHSGVYFAPIAANIDAPYIDDEKDDVADTYGQVKGWGSISKKLYAWTYSLFPYQGLIFCNTVDVMQENYQLLLDCGATMIQDQTEHYQKKITTGWGRLKAYLMSKLQWDNSLNMDELMDTFFVHYFGEAADTMQSLFDQQREWYAYIYADKDAPNTISADLLDENYWSYNQVQNYLRQIEKAYEDIAPLKETDSERYTQLYNRILLESLQYRYISLSIFSAEYSEVELVNERNKFRADFELLGLTQHKESYEISVLWDEWGIN